MTLLICYMCLLIGMVIGVLLAQQSKRELQQHFYKYQMDAQAQFEKDRLYIQKLEMFIHESY